MAEHPFIPLIDALVSIGGAEAEDVVGDARVQAPGIALEYLVGNLAWRQIPIPEELLRQILAVATWPELREEVERLLTDAA